MNWVVQFCRVFFSVEQAKLAGKDLRYMGYVLKLIKKALRNILDEMFSLFEVASSILSQVIFHSLLLACEIYANASEHSVVVSIRMLRLRVAASTSLYI